MLGSRREMRMNQTQLAIAGCLLAAAVCSAPRRPATRGIRDA